MTQLDHLVLETKFEANDVGEIKGIAWDFSSADRVGDVIEPTAFAGMIGKTIPALFAHDQSQVVGVFDQITVEADGLHVKGRLLVDTVERAREVRSMIQAKAVQGLSIGFLTRKAAPRKGGGRTIQELELLETSIVAVPAHPNARITSQKDITLTTTPTAATAAPATEQAATPAVDTKALDAIQKRLDAIEAASNRLAADNDNDAPEGDVEVKAFNMWARTGQVDAELKTLTVGTPSAGGYTVAPEYWTNVLTKVTEMSPIRQLASVTGVGTNKVYVPVLSSDAAGSWVAETGTRTEDEPEFTQVGIDVFEYGLRIPVSRQLLEDSFIDMSSFLAGRTAIGFAKAESTAFVHGNGTTQPEGFLAAANISKYEVVDAAQDGSDILEKVLDAYYALPSEYAARGSWLMNRSTIAAIRKAADLSTTRTSIWSDGVGVGTPARLLGAPIYEAPDMDDIASGESPIADTYPIAFADWASAYQIVDRVGLEILRDDYTSASTGVVNFHNRRRLGGKVLKHEALVLVSGSAA